MKRNIPPIDWDGPITIDELKDYWQANDPLTQYLETPEYSTIDESTASEQEIKDLAIIESIFSHTWDQEMRKISDRIYLDDYTNNYPVLALKNGAKRVIATTVSQILRNERVHANVMKIGYDVLKEPFVNEVKKYCREHHKLPIMLSNAEKSMIFGRLADLFLARMMFALQDVLNLPKIAKVCSDNKTFEDFNRGLGNKSRKKFWQKWYHTRVKNVSIVSWEELFESDKEDTALWKSSQSNRDQKLLFAFCETLDDIDKQILLLCYDGLTQKEIAEILEFASQGTIAKRKKKLLAQFKTFIAEYHQNTIT